MVGITVVNKFDERRDKKFPIVRGEAQTFSIVSGTTLTKNININGTLIGYIYTCPDLTTDTTFTIDYLDMDDTVMYTKNDLADNQVDPPLYIALDPASELVYLHGAHKMRITYTTPQTAEIIVVPIYR